MTFTERLRCLVVIWLADRSPRSEFATGVLLGFVVVASLPWILTLRRTLSGSQADESVGWTWFIRGLLISSVACGPIGSGIVWIVFKSGEPYDSFTSLGAVLGTLFMFILTHALGWGLFGLAFVIQLCRDRWCSVLTIVSVCYQLVAWVQFVRLNS